MELMHVDVLPYGPGESRSINASVGARRIGFLSDVNGNVYAGEGEFLPAVTVLREFLGRDWPHGLRPGFWMFE